MGYLITIILLAVLSVPTLADNCGLAPVHGRVVTQVGAHEYRGVRNARVIIIRGLQTWIAVTNNDGRYSVPVPACGTYEITAVQKRFHFSFQTFRFPDDADSANVDIVSEP